jgi:hypothetical protein
MFSSGKSICLIKHYRISLEKACWFLFGTPSIQIFDIDASRGVYGLATAAKVAAAARVG